jgi:hypothetical protein
MAAISAPSAPAADPGAAGAAGAPRAAPPLRQSAQHARPPAAAASGAAAAAVAALQARKRQLNAEEASSKEADWASIMQARSGHGGRGVERGVWGVGCKVWGVQEAPAQGDKQRVRAAGSRKRTPAMDPAHAHPSPIRRLVPRCPAQCLRRGLSVKQAAAAHSVGPTHFKATLRRRFGLAVWPARNVKSVAHALEEHRRWLVACHPRARPDVEA